MSDDQLPVPTGSDKRPSEVIQGESRLYRTISPAVQVLQDLMEDPDQEGYVRLNAANSVLDRVGLGKRSTVDHHHEVQHGLDPQIEQLVERMKRKQKVEAERLQIAAAPAEPVIEVVGEEVEDAEVVEDAPERQPQSVVLDFESFITREPDL